MQTAQQILAGPDYFLCDKYNCRMSRTACRTRKREAHRADEEGKVLAFGKCLECEGQKEGLKVDQKVCPVDGCGKPVKARGMCMTHYYREYSKGKFPTKRNPADLPDPPNSPESKTAQASPEKKPAKNIPNNIPHRTVNVQFKGPDVALWEMLKDRARKNRRDIRIEALVIIENALTAAEEQDLYS